MTFSDKDYDEYIFQILLYENQEFKLVYGKKKDIHKNYNIDSLSLGVNVDPNFVDKQDIEYPTVFFLLKCRKLSQVVTSTWLTPSQIDQIEAKNNTRKNQIILTRQILDSYNIIPHATYWLHKQNESNDEYELRKVNDQDIHTRLEEEDNQFYCITPTHISYRSISLVLLLCGQAYYKENNAWTKICEPIFSTYETIWEYGLDISWDTYYSTRIDVSQAGKMPVPPFTSVVLGYPPKPNTFSLEDDKIEYWVNSNEYDSGENKYPFYPQKGTIEWEKKDLKYIVPPYPYIPLSCL
ncbi:MAG: hypothetical protein F6K23_23775 [Okeania sp. SIO2C9]|uniref:hypothetical protein n=1 Tax=Okeania sp. SIO2C9 TaxID=2607791 RepID=UPI0013BEF092|nr:hypothetical protein [Okeania sp. SIO2C9]NEQ75794.1 hypothetical protein [Okeania sp. SIO2C9]